MKNLYIILSLILSSFTLVTAQETCNNYWSQISPDGNYFYFHSDRSNGIYEIYRCNIDGTNTIKLSSSDDGDYYPAISPDGNKIVFQRGAYGASAEIYIMDSDGSNLTQLTSNGVHDGFPNFSPDGNTIVFEAWDGSNYPEVFKMKPDGTERIQLTNKDGAYWQSAPIYNPSGTKIYFSAGYNADNYYVMMDLDGSNWVNITEPNSFGYAESGLQFNYDGSKIVFHTSEYVGYNNGMDIVIADSDGTNWQKITSSSNGSYYYTPFFHHTNNLVYYSYLVSASSGKWNVYSMKQDGSDKTVLTDCTALSLSDFDVPLISIYPNPSSDYINIEYNENFIAEIFDINGKLISVEENTIIDISNLNPNVYYILLRNEDNKLIRKGKFIKE